MKMSPFIEYSKMPVGAGKAGVEIERLSQKLKAANAPKDGFRQLRLLCVNRREIEARRISTILSVVPVDIPADHLRELGGRLLTIISGYDTCPNELYEVGDVRSYFGGAHFAWPLWIFGADKLPAFRALVLCAAPDVQIIRSSRSPWITARISRDWVQHFFESSLEGIAMLHSHAKISAQDGVRRLGRIAGYLGI